ncbi:MAG: hypothetical protein KKB31_01875, partial [Nanoarchaeota archaeon]|nr:hypothetical protein [Nanoarchaeota archaeon]
QYKGGVTPVFDFKEYAGKHGVPVTTPTEPQQTYIDLPTTKTKKQIRESEFLGEMYGGGSLGEMYGGGRSWIGEKISNVIDLGAMFGGKRDTSFEEAFSMKQFPSLISGKGTMISVPTPDVELTEGALYTRLAIGEEIGAGIAFETDITRKREEIIERISPDGITEAEAIAGTSELKSYFETQSKRYERDIGRRAEAREQLIFETRHPYEFKAQKYVPEIKFFEEFKPYETEKKIWSSFKKSDLTTFGIDGATFRKYGTMGIVGGISLGKGFYEGFKEKPLKTVGSLGIGAGLTIATAGLGTVAVSGGYIGATTLGTAGRIVGGTALTAYGVSAGARIAMTPGKYEKFEMGGKIISTEALPFALGAKVGGYGMRRYIAYSELRGYTSQLSKDQQKLFKAQLKEAKQFYRIEPTVKELDLSRLSLLEGQPGAQKALIDYFGGRKQLIVGGSIAQQTQLYGVKTKRPGDIDIYVKRFLGEGMASQKYAREAADILGGYGIKGIKAQKGKLTIGGKKLIEFHPYKSYLRFNIEQVAPWYRGAGSGITKTPSGIKVLRLPVQWQRKLVGGYLEPFMTGKHRLKDIPAAMAIRKSLFRTEAIKTTRGIPKIEYVGKESLGKYVFGETEIGMRFGKFKPLKIKIAEHLKGLPKLKQEIILHEKVHALHPEFTEKQVRVISGEREWEIALGTRKIKKMAESDLFKGRDYYSYKPSKDFGYYLPTKQPSYFGYKPSKPIIKTPPYQLKVPPTIIFPPKKTPSKYKPYKPYITFPPYTPHIPPGIFIFEEPFEPFVPIKPTKKKKTPKTVSGGLKQPFGDIKDWGIRRKLFRTPSYGQILRLGLNLPTLKQALPKGLEQTGISPRAWIKPQKMIPPLGALPFKIRGNKL